MDNALALILLLVCGWAIVSPLVPTGILLTLGLACFVVAGIANMDVGMDNEKIITVMAIGAVLCVSGLLIRSYRRARKTPRPVDDHVAE